MGRKLLLTIACGWSALCAFGAAHATTLNEPVGTSSPVTIATMQIAVAGTLGGIAVTTQGVAGLDFNVAAGGTCLVGSVYSVGQTCTVDYTFTPTAPGVRYGGIVLSAGAGTAMSTQYLQGTGTGPLVHFTPPQLKTLALANTNTPSSIAIDAAGNLYLDIAVSINSPNNAVLKETRTSTGFMQSVVATGLAFPIQAAVDGAGNVYIADQDSYQIVKESPTSSGYVQSSLFPGPVEGVAVDGQGNVYISYLDNGIVKCTFSNGSYSQKRIFSTNYNTQLAVDGNGNVYLGSVGIVLSPQPDGSYAPSSFPGGYAMAVDANGNVFAGEQFHSVLWEEEPSSGGGYTTTTLGTFQSSVEGVGLDGSGNVYFGVAGSVMELDYTDPANVVFANTPVGTFSADSPRKVTIENAGNAPLIFTPSPLGNPYPGPAGFLVDSSSTCPILSANASPATLGVEATCSYGVDFWPAFPGTVVQGLSIFDNAPKVDSFDGQTVALVGFGTAGLPVVTSLTPTSGPLAGGTTVTIGGMGFTGATAVSFGSVAATSFVVSNANAITAVSPAGTSSVDVRVTTPAGTSATTAADVYSYANPQPLTLNQPAAPSYVATSVALSTAGGQGGAVTYKVVSGPANVSGSTLTYSGAGTVVVEADQAGGNGYQAASAQATVNATLLSEPVGTTSSGVTTLVTIANAGTLGSIQVATQGAANADFALTPGGTCTVGATYAAGQTCTVMFAFDPVRPGQRYGGLALVDGSGKTMASSHVYGVGIGPQVGFLPGTQGLLGSGLSEPSGVAVDGNGNTFVSEYGGGLAEITAAGVQSNLGSFGVTSDVAVDGSGDVIVTDEHNVYEILAVNGSVPASPTVLTLGTGYDLINGVAVDATGNVFVATGTGNATVINGVATYDGALYELQAINGVIPQPSTPIRLGGGFGQLTGVAVDSSNNVYVSDGRQKAVYELMAVNGVIPSSPVMRSLGGGFTDPSNVRLDAANDVYLTDAGAAAVYEILAVNGSVSSANATVRTLGKGFSSPQGMVIDSKGNVFFADFGQSDVVTLNYSDPPTLSFATIAVGATSVDSPQTATLFNNGNAALTFGIPASGTNASISSGFTIGSGSTCPLITNTTSPAPMLAAGGYCTELVSFTPVAPGVDNGKLIATDNALNAPGAMQTVLLSGTGLVQTTTAIASSLNPAGVGVGVMFTATVSSSAGAPTGTVVFSDGTTQLGTGTLANGTATYSTNALTMGTHTITASYAATGEFGASSASLAQVIGYQSATTTAVTPEPSTYGQPVTFTVHVTGATGSTGTPSGTVTLQFCHGATLSITLDASGNGSIVQPYPGGASEPAGSCPYTANYAGDAYFYPSASASTPYIVNPSASTTTVSGAPNPGFVGQSVTLTATVAGNPSPTLGPGGVVLPPGATVATGTVQFFDGTALLGAATLVAAQNGVETASLTTSVLAAGAHSITAVYSGDANLNGSTSAPFVETIELAPTATTLSAAPNPGEQNHAVVLSVTVTALAGTTAPAGSVAIYDGSVLLTTLTALSPSGLTSSASFAATGLAPDTHALQAFFTPAAGFGPSQSSVVSLVILPQDFTLTANPPTMTVETEHHATMTLQLASLGGFAANIALNCDGPVPKWVTCYLPSQVALAADAMTPVSFTIDTDAVKFFKSEAAPPQQRSRGVVVLAGLLPLAMLGFARRWRTLPHLLSVAALSVAALSMTACSGYYPAHTEPGTYTVTVTAVGTTAGATAPTTHTLDVTLNVTP